LGNFCASKTGIKKDGSLESFFSSHKRKKRKEVIQPQVPLRLPCDDLTLLTEIRFATAKSLRLISSLLEWFDGHCVHNI